MSGGVRVTWEGKRAMVCAEPPPQLAYVETEGISHEGGWRNRLIHGDNLTAMAGLRPQFLGKVDLIYFDPPFFTGKQWNTRTDCEEGIGFSDDWNGNLSHYLQWLFDRLSLAYMLLSDEGCLYLHLSWHSVHYAKLLLDEIFGIDRFQNEIVWCYREAINSRKRWNRKHDTLLFYSKGNRFVFNCDLVREPYSESTIKKFRRQDDRGSYRLMGRGITGSPLRSKRDLPPEMETLFPDLTYRHYLGEGTLPVDYWYIDIENQASKRRTGYPTQKPEALLERILLASSNKGDLVADFCCGSGTTLAVAERLGRRWVGADANLKAIDITRSRLLETGAAFDLYRPESA